MRSEEFLKGIDVFVVDVFDLMIFEVALLFHFVKLNI